mmetsp:Transcript_34379/g.81163  ORF Transcript_34379/g.81163 Transcript_34379/m.81163 type:complete len:242 (-) Transcript_34379:920-1645(-)
MWPNAPGQDGAMHRPLSSSWSAFPISWATLTAKSEIAPIALFATSSIVSNNFVANAPMSRTSSSTPSKTLWISSPSSLKALPTSSINFVAVAAAFSAASFTLLSVTVARLAAASAAFCTALVAAFASLSNVVAVAAAALAVASAASTKPFDAASHVTLKPLSRSQTRRFLATTASASSAAFLAASAASAAALIAGSMTLSTTTSTTSLIKPQSRRPGFSPQSKRRRPVMTFDVVSASSSTV